jgi:hypothetical protein
MFHLKPFNHCIPPGKFVGILEYWSVGMMGRANLLFPNIPLFHHSIIPPFYK